MQTTGRHREPTVFLCATCSAKTYYSYPDSDIIYVHDSKKFQAKQFHNLLQLNEVSGRKRVKLEDLYLLYNMTHHEYTPIKDNWQNDADEPTRLEKLAKLREKLMTCKKSAFEKLIKYKQENANTLSSSETKGHIENVLLALQDGNFVRDSGVCNESEYGGNGFVGKRRRN
eukprot:3931928-Rhodomonas_salina.1